MPADASQTWDATLSHLILRVSRQNYDTWLRSTIGLRFEGTTLVVAAASELTCDWLSTRMRTVIAQALAAAAGRGLQVRFELAPTASGPSNGHTPPLQPSLLPDLPTPLNPRFTFATLLAADFNRLALCAAQDLAEGSGTYSPLFITGPGGSGKTHLMHAIAHAAVARGARTLLVGAEQFLSEFTTAVQNRTGAAFRARYRDLDVLLIDDLHLLLGKKATLNEFYQTVAGLHDQGRRLAVAGDPCATATDAARFKGQLRWGLIAAMEAPSIEDRVRFIAAKAAQQGVDLPDEVQHYLALRVRGSVRELEGAVNRVTALARISKETLDIDFAARALQPIAASPESQPPVAPSELLEAVCRHLGLSLSDIAGQKRARDLTYGRHLAMYLLRQEIGMTYAAIAHLVGKKDHSTVLHACTQIHRELASSPSLRADLDAISSTIHASHTAA